MKSDGRSSNENADPAGEIPAGSNPWFDRQRRILRLGLLPGLPVSVAIVAAVSFRGGDSTVALKAGVVTGILLVLLATHAMIVYRRVSSALRKAERSHDLLCFACLYDLSSVTESKCGQARGTSPGMNHPSLPRCPECGTFYDPNDLRRGWKSARLRRL